MRLGVPGTPHLTYCTNIHPGESWSEVRSNLEQHVVAVKTQLAPDRLFGVGLRLSARAAADLASGEELPRFKDYLRSRGLYVYTINGFPYGAFHRQRIKEDVYRPDWREEDRLRYTDRLADLLVELLPSEFPHLDGTISTVPLAFRPRLTGDGDMVRCAKFLIAHVARLVALRERTGKTISLALEPEPCCALEGVQDTVAFFERWLFSRSAMAQVGRLTGLGLCESEAALRRHLGICLDACHLALQFIEPQDAIAAFSSAGIRIVKVQISTGLRVVNSEAGDGIIEELQRFAESVYLHQAVMRTEAGTDVRYVDLPDAIEALRRAGSAWHECRVHFHVPIFLERLGLFSNTQPFLRSLLDVVAKQLVTPHLEVETYTWEVLPDAYRTDRVEESIVRELEWVLKYLEKSIHNLGRLGDIGGGRIPPAATAIVANSRG